MHCARSSRCRWMKTTPRPGSGLRHQHTGGPAGCGQYSISMSTPSTLAHPCEARRDLGVGRQRPRRSRAATRSPATASRRRDTAAGLRSAASDFHVLGATSGVRLPDRAAPQHAVAPEEHGLLRVARAAACASKCTTSMERSLPPAAAARARAGSGTAPRDRTRRHPLRGRRESPPHRAACRSERAGERRR